MDNLNKTIELPVLPLKGLVVFPEVVLHFDVGRKRSKAAILEAMRNDQEIFITAQKDPSVNHPEADDIYSIGVICKITQVINQSDDVIRIGIQGRCRGIIEDFISDSAYLSAKIVEIPEQLSTGSVKETALMRAVRNIFECYVDISPNFSQDLIYQISVCNDPSSLADFIANNLIMEFENKQQILETINVETRLERLIEILTRELNIINVETEIVEKTKNKIDENQREYFLREQLNVIQDELGESDNPVSETQNYINKIKELELSEEVTQTLIKECNRLSKLGFGSQEGAVIRTYLDTIIDLPWHTYSEENTTIKKAKSSLDKNHFGLERVKERIIEQLAVKILNPDGKANIICLAGPPGVGKTSIAQSVAQAINRKSVRIALGGIKDEAEIRGHRKTYIGSMPGRIINAIRTAGTSNPVIILDEVDKIGSDYKGDPTSALLEVLDSEQNHSFIDHYIEIPFDLSKVMFITTANDISLIPAPLRDRMDIIELPSYTREEKFNIAKKHLVKKQLAENGLDNNMFKISNKAIYMLIDSYTREAGVRTLERIIASLMRKSAVKILEDPEVVPIKITDKNVSDYLGPKKYTDDSTSKTDEIGLVNGLAWTSVGGTLLPIEVAVMKGKGHIELTGSLGDVMQESAKTAITCIRSHADSLKINPDFYKNCDIHIHAPEGAVPKDGPSAGITMATAIYSALSGKKVNHKIAMTGEITLRGNVMPIGGLREKSMAAYKNGINTVIIPFENKKYLEEIESAVTENISFVPVKKITDVLKVAIVDFEDTLPKSKKSVSHSDSYKTAIRQ